MPYTLAKFFIWGVLLALVGGAIGWYLRSLICRRQVAQARATTVDNDEVAQLRHRVANLEPVVAERDRLRMELADVRGSSAGALGFAAVGTPVVDEPEPLDLDAAAAAIGTKIALDDLTVVEGIGPKIAELCHGIGITTWRDLAVSDTDTLRSMLSDAGSRFQMHDPTSWPEQARLLTEGKWAEFKELTDRLDGGR